MKPSLALRLGPLAERDYRLLFSATTVTTLGDALAAIALAFAVLEVGTAAGLGIVLAARQGVEVVVLVFGAVLSDRIPRNLILVGASLVQATAQAGTGGPGSRRGRFDREDRGPAGALRSRAGLRLAGGDRARAGDREPLPAAAGQRVPGALTQHDRDARPGRRRRARRSRKPRARASRRCGQLSRRGGDPVEDPASQSACADRPAAVSQLAPRGLARVHLTGVAVALRPLLQRHDVRVRRLARGRAGRREGPARRSGSVGCDPELGRRRRGRGRGRRASVPPGTAARRLDRGGALRDTRDRQPWPSERRCG